MVKVPNFAEMTVQKVQEIAYQNSKIALYLPDYNPKRALNRDYLFNVSKSKLDLIDHFLSR